MLETDFASPERDTEENVLKLSQKILDDKNFVHALNSSPDFVVILNKNRQIVFANEVFLDHIKSDFESVRGKRIGEAVNCIHSTEMEAGCGTSESCGQCDAIGTTLQSVKEGKKIQRESRINIQGGDALDLLVSATPFDLDDDNLTITHIKDISSQKRKEIFERIFFHDIINSNGSIISLSSLGKDDDVSPEEKTEYLEYINKTATRANNEIHSYKKLSMAELGTLELELKEFDVADLINEIVSSFKFYNQAEGIEIKIKSDSADKITMKTDASLIGRVLVNYLKNALEASVKGDVILITFNQNGDEIEFSINNSKVMSKADSLQMFQRNFSTKGEGRGVGTYSCRLLTEKYLQGEVSMKSEEGEGTTFYARYPVSID